jgi:cation diffusion facilitator family transporter
MRTAPPATSTTPAPAAAREAVSRAVARVALWGVVVSFALLVLTVAIAALSHSLTLTAAAVDCGVDLVAAVVLWFGLRLADRTSARFPFGLYKVENVLQVVIALLLFVAAYEVAVQSLTAGDRQAEIGPWVVAGVVVSIAATWSYGWYATRVGRRVGSPALVADGRHRQTDVLSTSLVLVAVVTTALGVDVDRAAAVVIVAFAVYSGWRLLVAGMKVLLDAAVDAETTARIERIIAGEALVDQVDELAVRSAGRYLFLEATLRLRTEELSRAHAASERLERRIRAEVPAIERVNFHLEPRRRETWRLAVPLATPEGRTSGEFGESPYFAVVELRVPDGSVARQEVIANPVMGVEKQRGILVAEWLVGRGIDTLITQRPVNKGPRYVFGEAGVELRDGLGASLSEELARRGEAGA